MSTMNIYEMTDTWNSGATVFNAIKMNVGDTASDPASSLLNLQVGSVTRLAVNKNGSIVIAGDTVTSDSPVLNMTQTWNSGTTVFNAIKMNVTDTASASGSRLMDLQVGGSSRFSVSKDGNLTVTKATDTSNSFLASSGSVSTPAYAFKNGSGNGATTGMYYDFAGGAENLIFARQGVGQFLISSARIQIRLGNTFGWSSGVVTSAPDLELHRDAANTLAQRNGTFAQEFRVYGSYTDGSNFNRLNLSASSGGVTIRAAGAGTGVNAGMFIGTNENAALTLQTAATNRWNLSSTGHFLASTDNTYDIGAENGTGTLNNSPRRVISRLLVAGANGIRINSGSSTGVQINQTGDGILRITNWATTDFNRLQFGGTTSSFPAIKRDGANLRVRLADDSADTELFASSFNVDAPIVNDSAVFVDNYSLTGTATDPLIDVSGTWNTTGNPSLIKANVVDTASAADSKLLDLQVGGVTQFAVDKNGAVGVGTSAVNTAAIGVTGFSLTGTSAASMVDLAGTWNTTGTPTLIKANITDTASNANSLLMDLQVGSTSKFNVSKAGQISASSFTTTDNADNQPLVSGTGYNLTGTSGVSLMDLSGTWNTTGTPTLIKANVVDTASNAASLLMDLQVGGVVGFQLVRRAPIQSRKVPKPFLVPRPPMVCGKVLMA